MIFDHLGAGLDESVRADKWCQDSGISRGADYLLCWAAAMIQYPDQPLPYLFFYGPQDSGKSIFHEALSLLITGNGITFADRALTNPTGFNGELEEAILCIIEETDLAEKGRGKLAYNRMKDWVTSPKISIRKMRKEPYVVPNTTHWVQCANDRNMCPVMPGDTRVVVCYVGELENKIAKRTLLESLKTEAAVFLGYLLRMEIPESNDRLRLPVVTSSEKLDVMSFNTGDVEEFCTERLVEVPGAYLLYSEVFDQFSKAYGYSIGKKKFGSLLPPHILKGKHPTLAGQVCLGNVYWAGVDNPPKLNDPFEKEIRDGLTWLLPPA